MEEQLHDLPHVSKIVQCYLETGSTLPLLCLLDNGIHAVIKYRNNPQGDLVLVNEILSYKIAVAIGLKVPESGFCMFDSAADYSEEIKKNIADGLLELTEDNYGVSFYSRFVPHGVPLSFGLIPHIKNMDDFYRMILFDHLIYNKDRNKGNVLISLNKPIQFFAIDHSHVFKDQTIWDQYTFSRGIKWNDYKDVDILQFNDDVYSYFFGILTLDKAKLCQTRDTMMRVLTPQFYHAIIRGLPNEWTTRLTPEDSYSLENYLVYRTKHLGDICQLILTERGRSV